MGKRGAPTGQFRAILALSGGADSVYLLDLSRRRSPGLLAAHYNHGARGRASEADQRFVESLCREWGVPVAVGRSRRGAAVAAHVGRRANVPARFEERARETRYAFLKDLLARHKAEKIFVAHTADDQVETIVMRLFEGAGIAGLKGIPRRTSDGVERPLLDTWREEIIESLRKRKIPYRIDQSNFDTRFERNWIRHVLVPLLERRYGKAVKKRLHALGERFRELDEFLETTARRWIRRHVRESAGGQHVRATGPRSVGARGASAFRGQGAAPPAAPGDGARAGSAAGAIRLTRKSFSRLPAAVRKKVIQILFFERLGIAPNERLLESIDRTIREGGPSAALDVGMGAVLRCRYDEALFEAARGSGRAGRGSRRHGLATRSKGAQEGDDGAERGARPVRSFRMTGAGRHGNLLWEERGKVAAAALRRIAAGERGAVFDAAALHAPLSVRPLRRGDRIRPFGLGAEKKAKEVLSDRKVPRDERWGRPVVCDATGAIIWIPGVLRSDAAPVGPRTRRTAVLRLEMDE